MFITFLMVWKINFCGGQYLVPVRKAPAFLGCARTRPSGWTERPNLVDVYNRIGRCRSL